MKAILIILVALALTGCSVTLATWGPIAVQVGKTAYCEATSDEARAEIRETFNLPHIIHCPNSD